MISASRLVAFQEEVSHTLTGGDADAAAREPAAQAAQRALRIRESDASKSR